MSIIGTNHAEGRPFEPIHLSEPVSLWDLPTPALVVDLDAMEGNLRKMAEFYRDKKAGIRPHTKTHKCPIIAKKQMELGAVGICTAKVSEAEVMVAEGVQTTRSAYQLSRFLNVEMPIAERVYAILFEGHDPGRGVRDLMVRDAKPEIWA